MGDDARKTSRKGERSLLPVGRFAVLAGDDFDLGGFHGLVALHFEYGVLDDKRPDLVAESVSM